MGTPLLWVAFNLFVLLALALDLGVFHRQAHKIQFREAAIWTGVWIALSLGFGYFVWHWHGSERGLEYFTGYLIEKTLSVDNLFVFLVLFRAFRVPDELQHRVLGKFMQVPEPLPVRKSLKLVHKRLVFQQR